MSDNNTGIMAAGLIVAYLYMKRTQAAAYMVNTKAPLPASMPSSVGSGTKQIAVGALAGLLQSLANGPANNTSQSYFPSYYTPDTSSIAQESLNYTAPGVADLIDTSDFGWFA
jgi:hypothetical protein